jgi:hypothetical protein
MSVGGRGASRRRYLMESLSTLIHVLLNIAYSKLFLPSVVLSPGRVMVTLRHFYQALFYPLAESW